MAEHIVINAEGTHTEIESQIRAAQFTPNLVTPVNVATATFEWPNVKNKYFSVYTPPTINTYVKTYVSFLIGDINVDTIGDCFLIASRIKSFAQTNIITVTTNDAGIYQAIPSNIAGVPAYIYAEILNYAQERHDGVNTLTISPETTEETFKLFMEHFCMLIIRFLYKDGDSITEKTNVVNEGIQLLGIPYHGSNTYITLMPVVIKKIRSTAGNHIWKPMISVSLIDAYYRARSTESTQIMAYLEWSIMRTTHLLNFGLCRLVVECMELLNVGLRRFALITFSKMTVKEIKVCAPIIHEILKTPTPAELEQWIYFKWSGMINENFHRNLKYRNNPFLSSLCIGIINGSSATGDVVYFTTFAPSSYKHKYYNWGYRLAKLGDTVTDMTAGGRLLVGEHPDAPVNQAEEEDIDDYFG